MFDYAMFATVLSQIHRDRYWAEAIRDAGDDLNKQAAISAVMREQEAHRKAMEVARASAPVVNVYVRRYYD